MNPADANFTQLGRSEGQGRFHSRGTIPLSLIIRRQKEEV
jgi:hypothetical protein